MAGKWLRQCQEPKVFCMSQARSWHLNREEAEDSTVKICSTKEAVLGTKTLHVIVDILLSTLALISYEEPFLKHNSSPGG